jgi:hypothetical protein
METCKSITKKGKKCKKYKQKNCDTCWNHKTPKDICTICFEGCQNKKTLKCGHNFCINCISKWIYLEGKKTCPLCRAEVNYSEEYDAFEYCIDNQLISIFVQNQYIIDDQELIDYIKTFIDEDGHLYNRTNWNIILNHLKLDTRLYLKFLNIGYIISYTYVIYNYDEPGIIINGRSYIYNYQIIFDLI